MLHIGAHKLEVDFILNIGHHDECCDDAIALAGCESRRDLAIPHEMCARENGAGSVRGQGEKNGLVVVGERRAL